MALRVGICGYGPMARMHAQLLKLHRDVQIVGVGEVEEELRKRAETQLGVAVFPSGEALIDARIADIMFVCAPTYLHETLSVRALRSGCHVFCEKPMARSTSECERMIASARETGGLLMVGHVLRFWPEYVYLKQGLEQGRWGKVRTMTMLRIGNVTRGWRNWFLDESLGGTQIFDRHIHDSDLVLWLFGKPRSVMTWGREEQVGGFVHCFTRYDYPDKVVVAEGSADLPQRFPFIMAYTAVCEKATIDYSIRNKPTLCVYHDDGAIDYPDLPVKLPDVKAGLNLSSSAGYFLEQEYFLDCARRKVPVEIVTPQSGYDTVALVRREMESARSGKAVDIS